LTRRGKIIKEREREREIKRNKKGEANIYKDEYVCLSTIDLCYTKFHNDNT